MSLTHSTISGLFEDIADSIRAKSGGSAAITADLFPDAIDSLDVLDTSDATATASQIFAGETAYVDGSKITGTMCALASSSGDLLYSSSGDLLRYDPEL